MGSGRWVADGGQQADRQRKADSRWGAAAGLAFEPLFLYRGGTK